MRYGELTFLVVLVIYHAFLLVPRFRRPFAANYLVFLAGAALGWNLGLEGLRWQTLPAIVLILVDLFVLFPSFASLRGRAPQRGFFRFVGRFFRGLLAWAGWLVAVASVVLAVAFPLPRVELTGGLPPGYRVVRFPASADQAPVELQIWYPASGDLHSASRPNSLTETWQRQREAGGLPVFWQSYLDRLPSSLIKGGKLASAGTKYPVVYVAVPRGQDPSDFGYLFEDLASRGFLVVAPTAVTPMKGPAAFSWTATWTELSRPFVKPELWLEPELSNRTKEGPADYHWLVPAQAALKQLDGEPGDLLFGSVDWTHQGLWAWGTSGAPPSSAPQVLGLRGVVQAGGTVPAGHQAKVPELWIMAGAPPPDSPRLWTLTTGHLQRSDLADAAYLKPYLAFFGLKSQADAGPHAVLRQYQAAFFQFVFWSEGNTTFSQTVPEVPGITLTGK